MRQCWQSTSNAGTIAQQCTNYLIQMSAEMIIGLHMHVLPPIWLALCFSPVLYTASILGHGNALHMRMSEDRIIRKRQMPSM